MRDSGTATESAVQGRAYARAALLGNPSDGFGGKTIGFTFAEFEAEVTLSPEGQPEPAPDPDARALVAATVARLRRMAPGIPQVAATVRTTIPREIGLGGSSAIVIATVRALRELRGTELDGDGIAALALAVETEDLGIAAGPQDRLIQAHEGLLYMDFSGSDAGRCERLDHGSLPPLFVAWRPDSGQPSGTVHAELRRRYRDGDRRTRTAMAEIAALAERGRECLLNGDTAALGPLLEANISARARLVELDPRHLRMIELARELGAPANYAGSGGAIVGIVPAGATIADLRAAFRAEGCDACTAAPAGGFSA